MEFRRRRLAWLLNGMVAGLLFAATLNSLSYFFRSGGWGNLFKPRQTPQALGFPWEVWRYGVSYENGAMVDSRAMLGNLAVGLIVGVAFGLLAIWNRDWLNRFSQNMIDEDAKKISNTKMQFSLRGMLVVTGIVAVVAGVLRAALGARPEVLLCIYLFGPLFLIVLSMLPRGLPWQHRILLLTPATLLMIAFAIFVGQRLGLEFDHVMMGIFIFWVPQSVIAAACVTIGLGIRYKLQPEAMIQDV